MKRTIFCLLALVFFSDVAMAEFPNCTNAEAPIDQTSPSDQVKIYHYECSIIPSYLISEVSKGTVALLNYVTFGEDVVLKKVPLKKINSSFDQYIMFAYFCEHTNDLLEGFHYTTVSGYYNCEKGNVTFVEYNPFFSGN